MWQWQISSSSTRLVTKQDIFHRPLSINIAVVLCGFLQLPDSGEKRKINGYKMIQLYDRAMYSSPYPIQSIYLLRIYAEMSYKLTDINYCITHTHTGLGSTPWLVACCWFRIVHHIIAPILGWWGTVNCRGYTRISVSWAWPWTN